MLIEKPGFYTSKAGKCEVVAVRGGFAIGWRANGTPGIWHPQTGNDQVYDQCGWDIASIWTDKPKPIECWMVYIGQFAQPFHYTSWKEANEALDDYLIGNPTARLVHLIEAEDKG